MLDDLWGSRKRINSGSCREFQKVYSMIQIEKRIGIEEDEVPKSPEDQPLQDHSGRPLTNIAKHSKGDRVIFL